MHVALIFPPALLKKYGETTRYHLVLPHLYPQRRYKDFYRERSETGDYIILDNGAAEGFKFGLTHLYQVAQDMGVHEIVVPDTLGDMNDTIAKGLAFTRYTRGEYRYMAVAQGQSIKEIMQCIDMYATDAKFAYVTTVGIPRLINIFDPIGRIKITEFIIEKGYNRALEFHYLGASAPFNEVKQLAVYGMSEEGIRGIDTSGPIYMSQKKYLIDEDSYVQRPKNYFKMTKVDSDILEYNINTYLNWAMYSKSAPIPTRPQDDH